MLNVSLVMPALLMGTCDLGEGLTDPQQANLFGFPQMWPFATNSKCLRKMGQGVTHHLFFLSSTFPSSSQRAAMHKVSSEPSLLPDLLHSKLQVLSEAMSKLLTVQLLAMGLPP